MTQDQTEEPGAHHSSHQEQVCTKKAEGEYYDEIDVARLTGILSSISEIVWSRRADDNSLLYINKACETIYGYTREELMAMPYKLSHIHPDDVPHMKSEIERTIRTGRGEMEYRVFHKDGTMRYLYGNGILCKGRNGEPDIINGVSMDITRLREAELKLKQVNQEMEHIFESINDSFIALDHDFKFTYINKEAERVYNCKREELLYKNIWDFFPKARNLKFFPELTHAMQHQVSVHFEEFSPTADIWVSVNAYPTQSGLAVYFSDVTEQRRLQEKIINDEQKLRAIINNTKDIIWSMDRNMQIISANQAYYDRIAYMTANKPYDTLTTDDFDIKRVEEWRSYIERAFQGETFSVIIQDEVKGEKVFEDISFNPIYDKEHVVFGVSCFSRNITEQQKQLERIQQQNEKLSEIAWLQSHQVRGPVATILGLVPLFNYKNPADPDNLEILEMIQATAQQLDQNIKEVVNKTRI